jgi:hypothetical protein
MKGIAAVRSWAPADLFHFFVRAFTSGIVWLGFGLLLMFFLRLPSCALLGGLRLRPASLRDSLLMACDQPSCAGRMDVDRSYADGDRFSRFARNALA